MLDKLAFLVMFISVVIFIFLFVQAKKSNNGEALGLAEKGEGDTRVVSLYLCSSKPNCVCSEAGSDAKHAIEPYSYTHLEELEIDSEKLVIIIWQSLIMTLKNSGAVFHEKRSDYIAATFATSFLGFIDDFEVRLDTDAKQIHFRSASRVGTSDFGTNAKRVRKVIQAMEVNLEQVLNKIS